MPEARHATRPVEVALITAEAVRLVAGTPVIERTKDGREVLLRGPRLTPGDTPAEKRAAAQRLMVIKLSARELLTIAQGTPVDVGPGWTERGCAARVRLATRTEVMLFNRRAIASLREEPYLQDADALPPPLDASTAAELVAPIDIGRDQFRQLVARFDPFHFG